MKSADYPTATEVRTCVSFVDNSAGGSLKAPGLRFFGSCGVTPCVVSFGGVRPKEMGGGGDPEKKGFVDLCCILPRDVRTEQLFAN